MVYQPIFLDCLQVSDKPKGQFQMGILLFKHSLHMPPSLHVKSVPACFATAANAASIDYPTLR